MTRPVVPKPDPIPAVTRNDLMLESVLGSPQAYVRARLDSAGKTYFALTSTEGEMLATFAARKDAEYAMQECKLMEVTLH